MGCSKRKARLQKWLVNRSTMKNFETVISTLFETLFAEKIKTEMYKSILFDCDIFHMFLKVKIKLTEVSHQRIKIVT